MHLNIHNAPLPILGTVMLAFGAAVLLTSPKIVWFNVSAVEYLNNWFLKAVAETSGIRLTLPGQSILWKGLRFSYWFTTLLVGISLGIFGTMLLFEHPFSL